MRRPNTTFDVYQAGSQTLSNQEGFLRPQWIKGNEKNEPSGAGDRTHLWTHWLEVPENFDIRDNWPSAPTGQDYVVIPSGAIDEDHIKYHIIHVELERDFRGDPFKRVFLQRAGQTMAIDVREKDLSPSLTSITQVTLDQDQGLTLSNPTANEAEITIADADGSVTGVVSSTTQTFGGAKTFQAKATFSSGLESLGGATIGGAALDLLSTSARVNLNTAKTTYVRMDSSGSDDNIEITAGQSTGDNTMTLNILLPAGGAGEFHFSTGGSGATYPPTIRIDDSASTSKTGFTGTGGGGDTFVSGICTAAGSSTGITSLNGETGATQTFARVDDTNVTLTISSATNTHTFTVGWSGTLSHERGGLEADVSAGDGFVQIKGGSTTVIKTNHSASANPTGSDDESSGYAVGSRWIDTSNQKEWVCLDATTSVAVWTETTAGSSLDINGLTAGEADDLDDEIAAYDNDAAANRKHTYARVGGLLSQGVNDGRLTLHSSNPTGSDLTGNTIYFHPYVGNRVCLYDGTRWNLHTFTTVSKALSALTSGKNYDVFLYDDSGTLTLEFTAWTDDTTRATALTRQDGVLVKSGDATRRYLGSFRTTSVSSTADSVSRRLLWNYYHRLPRRLVATEPTDSWSYTTGTFRSANANTTLGQTRVEILLGEDDVEVEAMVHAVYFNSATTFAKVGIGLSSTSVNSANVFGNGQTAETCVYRGTPGLGYYYLQWLEFGVSGATWYGDNGATSNTVQSGLLGRVWA